MKKNKSKILVVLLIIFISLTTIVTAKTDGKINEIPQKSEEFKRWEELPEEERKNVIQPRYSSIDLKSSIKRSEYNNLLKLKANLEPKYNLQSTINLNVKNQQMTESCWAFSFTNMLESTMALKYKKLSEKYSPMHMEYQVSKMFNKKIIDGGNSYLALAYNLSGYGPVNEKDFAFESVYNESTNKEENCYLVDVNTVDLNKPSKSRINNAKFLPGIYKSYDKDSQTQAQTVTYKDSNAMWGANKYTKEQVQAMRQNIKKCIKENGAVSALIEWKSILGGTPYYNDVTHAYYDNSSLPNPNHAVTIIGWDDNYAVSNFKTEYQPVNPGAYIVLNSWGTEFGDNGIFYVSYDDACIEQSLMSIESISEFTKDSSDVYDTLYQYDELGMTTAFYALNDSQTECLKNAYVANIFTKKDTSKEEYLNEVGIYIDSATGVEIYVNTSDDNLNNLELVASKTGVNALESGYHTIKLSTPRLLKGQKFVVAVKYINNEELLIPIECNLTDSGFASTANLFDKAKSNPGESFYSKDGKKWDDINGYKLGDKYTLKNTSACVKAFTITGDKVVNPEVAVTGITLNKNATKIQEGNTETVVATVKPENATNKKVIWTSSDDKIATVKDGVITGVSKGTATITAKTEAGNYTSEIQVTVEEKANINVPVTGMTVNKKTLNLEIGNSETIIVKITPETATNKKVIWTTSDEKIAKVQNGIITGVSKGIVTITAKTEDGNYTNEIQVTVGDKKIPETKVAVTGITLDKNKITMQVGESNNAIIAEVTPKNATNKNTIWTSSNEEIATVTNAGIITAKKPGKAIITVKTEDGGFESKCELTVTKKTNNQDDIYQKEEFGNNENNANTNNSAKETETKTNHKVLPFAGENKLIIWGTIGIFIIAIIVIGFKNLKYKDIK